MPWVDEKRCIGCAICVNLCPTNAMKMKNAYAVIDMQNCIRCGKCHEFCPQDAVRHDSEKIPMEIQENIQKTKDMMKYFKTLEEKRAFLERTIKHFNKEKTVAEKTMDEIKKIEV
ncbi:4Fe-4S binding protein [candidate division WOR-3 bacterium]|nr:4Fe-4S binding protein [candidate division WOR-3 bacterium]